MGDARGQPGTAGTRPAPAKANVMSIRGTADWRAWLGRYAARRRVTSTALIDQALAEAARRDGFEPPPPRY